MVEQKSTFVLQFPYRSVSGVVFMVDFIPCRFMFRCPIVVPVYSSRCLLINTSVRPVHVLSKKLLIAFSRLVVVEINSAAWKYFVSYGLVVWARILFTTGFYCFVIRGNSQIPVCLFLVNFNVCCPLFWTVIYFWSSFILHL